jgi:glyoxylase-like metal-dependent hydrolase (beta-lactamase superfamily II)
MAGLFRIGTILPVIRPGEILLKRIFQTFIIPAFETATDPFRIIVRLKIILILLLGISSSAAHGQEGGLRISHLAGDYYVYTTYRSIDGVPFPSNSMYVVTDSGVVIIDTPWDAAQTEPLLDSIAARHGKRPVICIVTHSHDDRTAGLDILKAHGVATYSTFRTDRISREKGEKLAEHHFTGDTTFKVGALTFKTYFPGEGHTSDNIVVWFPKARILYGGCLVKSVDSPGLGNIADANLAQWPATIRNLSQKFGMPRFIIPGHQGWTSRQALEHTMWLLKSRK